MTNFINKTENNKPTIGNQIHDLLFKTSLSLREAEKLEIELSKIILVPFKKTIFKKVITNSMINNTSSIIPEHFDNVVLLMKSINGITSEYHDMFYCYNNDMPLTGAIYFGIAGDEFK